MSKDDGQTGEHDIGRSKDGDCHKDDISDLMIDGVKELDKANEEQKDCRVHQERDVLDYPTCMEQVNAFEKVCADPDSTLCRPLFLREPKVPASPLLYQRSGKGARKADAKAEEPHDVHVDGRGLRFECVAGREVVLCTIGYRSQLLCDLLEKPHSCLSRIRLEGLVAFYKKCGDCCGKYTRLEVNQCECQGKNVGLDARK